MELKEHIDDIRNRLENEEYPNERAEVPPFIQTKN